jgi:hypothetical protein
LNEALWGVFGKRTLLDLIIRYCCGDEIMQDEIDWTCSIKDVGQKTSILGAKFYCFAVLCRVEGKNDGAIPPFPISLHGVVLNKLSTWITLPSLHYVKILDRISIWISVWLS